MPPLSAPTEEANNPILINPEARPLPLGVGENYFKFEIEPGFHYSFIINTNRYDHHLRSRGAPAVVNNGYTGNKFQSEMYGFHLSDHGVPLNISSAKSAIMFFADPGYHNGKYYNYCHLSVWDNIPNVWIKLLKLSEKTFAHPFRGTLGYYNTFKHRTILNGRLTRSGHDGIDLQPYTLDARGELALDDNRPIRAVADGEVIKIRDLGSIGQAVWINHSTASRAYTGLYAHLQNILVSVGQRVVKGETELGTMDPNEDHLHLEVFPKITRAWNRGYTNGGGGQLDALKAVFEK